MTKAMNEPSLKFNPVLAPVLIPILFFFRELTGQTAFAGFDFTHLILPFHQFARESVNSGNLPEWNPYMFAGFPQLAEGEGGFFYPGNLLMLLPGDQSLWLSWTVVLHIILAGLLMYAFLRNRGVSEFSSSWMAVFYQLLPGMLLRAETTGLLEAVCWLPGLFLCLEKAGQTSFKKNYAGWLKWTLLSSGVIGLMLLTGSSQIAFYGMLGGFFYLCGFAWMGPQQGRRALWAALTLILTVVMAGTLAAVQLVPTSLFSQLSYRVQEADFEYYRIGTWLNFPRLASLFMFPSVKLTTELMDYISSLGYVGLLPFTLIGIALARYRNRMNPILPPFVLMFFGLILSFGMNLVVNQDLLSFPGFNLFRAMGRMILPTSIALFALGGAGLDLLLELKKSDQHRAVIISGTWVTLIFSVLLLIWFLLYEGFPPGGFEILGLVGYIFSVVVIIAGLVVYLKTKNTKWLVSLLAVWLVMQFVSMTAVKSAFTMTKESYSEAASHFDLDTIADSYYPDIPPRVIVGIETDVWTPLLDRMTANPFAPAKNLPIPAFGNELTMGGVGVLNAYTPLITERWYKVAHEYAAKGLTQDEVTHASLRMRRILALLRANALVTPESFTGGDDFASTPGNFETIFFDDWHILKPPDPIPYVHVPEYVEAWEYSDWEYFKHWIVQENYIPGEWVCVEVDEDSTFPPFMVWGDAWTEIENLEDPLGNSVPNFPSWAGMKNTTLGTNGVENLEYSIDGDGLISVRADGGKARWVVFRESYMDGWTATVDGVDEEIYPADYLFMAVPIPPGDHDIELKYETPGLRTGGRISVLGLILWVILFVVSSVRLKK